jgi:NADPH:quinone reductase-like Zn-dependent oxidoreductase
MLAAFVEKTDPDKPVDALVVGDRPDPAPRDGWEVVEVKAASLNRHDLFSLRGQGLPDAHLPMILGCDAAGVTDSGRRVVVHSVIRNPDWTGDELADPRMNMLSEVHQGTFAEKVLVPSRNLLDIPPNLSFEEAACLPTAWVTAYRMLYGQAALTPGDTVLVQGATGGLSSALIALGSAGGLQVWVTTRDLENASYAESIGAASVLQAGARLPERVDAVMDSAGAATWDHSLKSLKPTGVMVAAGGTAGFRAEVDVARVFANRLRIIGTAMGTLADLSSVLRVLADHDLKPHIDCTLPLDSAPSAVQILEDGTARGKIVLTM